MYAVYTRILRNTIYSTCIWYDVVSRMYYVCYSYYNPRCLHLATSLLVDVHAAPVLAVLGPVGEMIFGGEM